MIIVDISFAQVDDGGGVSNTTPASRWGSKPPAGSTPIEGCLARRGRCSARPHAQRLRRGPHLRVRVALGAAGFGIRFRRAAVRLGESRGHPHQPLRFGVGPPSSHNGGENCRCAPPHRLARMHSHRVGRPPIIRTGWLGAHAVWWFTCHSHWTRSKRGPRLYQCGLCCISTWRLTRHVPFDVLGGDDASRKRGPHAWALVDSGCLWCVCVCNQGRAST